MKKKPKSIQPTVNISNCHFDSRWAPADRELFLKVAEVLEANAQAVTQLIHKLDAPTALVIGDVKGRAQELEQK